jgi:hypothetical protein
VAATPATIRATVGSFGSTECAAFRQVLAHRRSTLESNTYGVCALGAVGPGLTVVFRYHGDTVRRTGRAVTMTAGFDSLRVQHQDFILANVADSGAACSRAGPVTRPQLRSS